MTIPDAVEVGMASTKIIDGNHATNLTVVTDRFQEFGFIGNSSFQYLDNHPVWRDIVQIKYFLHERCPVRDIFTDNQRVDVQKQPGIFLVLNVGEIGQVQASADPVYGQQLGDGTAFQYAGRHDNPVT